MTIFLPITLSPTGGTSTFAQKFQAGMETVGHQVIFRPSQSFDVLLVPASCPFSFLAYARVRKIPIIQRLDGVYYPQTVVGRRYWLHNIPLQVIYRYFADGVIYQSKYSAELARRFLGTPKTAQAFTIYNGVDTDHFQPDGPAQKLRDNADQHVFITWSRFRRPDQIFPLLEAFKRYREHYRADSRLVIAGDFHGAVRHVPHVLRQTANVEYLGVIPNRHLPAYARGSDVFVFTHQNPPCPNNVLEAAACGLPICGINDGAMPEITLPSQSSELIPAPGDGFWQPRKLSLHQFADNLSKIMQQQAKYAAASRQDAVARFSLANMVEQYARAIESVIHTA